jgi:hypothetical protein
LENILNLVNALRKKNVEIFIAMSTKKDMVMTSSNNSEHYIKNVVYYNIKKEERFASLPTPVRVFIRRMILERRYDLLFDIVKLSREITSSHENKPSISKVWYCNLLSWCGPI